MQQFRELSRTRTIYNTETHTSDFILNTFWNGKPVQFFQERCWVVVTGCQENKSCSKVLNFLERLDDRIRCTHEETVAVVKPWKDRGSNKSLGCVFSEKPADWTNAFKLEISSLADYYDVILHGQFWVKNESKVPGRIREGDVVRAKSNRVREGNGRRFQGRRKGKEKSFCFVVIQFELIFRHPCFFPSTPCLSSSLLPSSFYYFLSSYTWWRLSVESACVQLFLVFRRLGEYISLEQFCQPHQQLLTHSLNNKTSQSKADKYLASHFSLFNCSLCCFVAWKRGLPWNCMCYVLS